MCKCCSFPGLKSFHGHLIDFKFGRKIYRSFAWRSGISSLSRLSDVSFDSKPLSFLADIQQTWRQALGRLASTQWQEAYNFETMLRLLNCVPYGASVKPKGRFCEFSSVCPWCWARAQLSLVKHVSQIVNDYSRNRGPIYKYLKNKYPKFLKSRACASDLQLVYGSIVTKEPDLQHDGIRFNLGGYFDYVSKGRCSVVNSMRTIGARHMFTAEPMLRRFIRSGTTRDFWKLKSRFLCLFYKQEPFIDGSIDGFKCISPPDNLSISKAVSEVFKYPAGYLLSNPILVGELFNTKSKFRTMESYGILRKFK